MSPLIALQIALQMTVQSMTDRAVAGARSRLGQLRHGDRDTGLSTLEISILALGLFLIASIAVLVLTNATNTRLNQIK